MNDQEKDKKLIIDKNLSPELFSLTPNEFREIILKSLGFKLLPNIGYHILYSLPYIISEKLKKEIQKNIINKNQKINRFFNYYEYVSKSLLYLNYKKMMEIFPSEYNYMLETYSFPEDKDIIYKKFANYSYNNNSKDNLWLIKPKLGREGRGISILKNISEINNKILITKFLNNPHLIKGYKYDIRIHGLVTSIKPLIIYLYKDGILRLSTVKYNPNDQSNKQSFITNVFININNKKYIYPQNLKNIEDSNLWNLKAFKKYCLRKGLDFNKIFNDIGDLFIKMIFSVRKKIIDNIKYYKLKNSNFYHLIGSDILLDENLKPYLLENNRLCGFSDDNDAEKPYTHKIVIDTINLVGLRINKENNTKDDLMEIINDSLCELDRPRGGYKLIFPLKNNIEKYKKFYLNNIPEEDIGLWKELKY